MDELVVPPLYDALRRATQGLQVSAAMKSDD